MNRRLVTEAALAIAPRLLDAFRDRFDEAEWPAAFGTCFDIAKAGIEGYAVEQERLRRWRLSPDPAANPVEAHDG